MTEYVIKVHINVHDEELVEAVTDVIAHMLCSPRVDDPTPDAFGMPGVTFEGMLVAELDEHGNEVMDYDTGHSYES